MSRCPITATDMRRVLGVAAKRRKRGHPEQDVIDKTIAATRSCLLWFRVHSGIIDIGFRKVVFGKKGRVDYFAIRTPDGKFVAVEFKAPGKKSTVTQEQLDCLEAVRRAGGIAVLADCPEDVVNAIGSCDDCAWLTIGCKFAAGRGSRCEKWTGRTE